MRRSLAALAATATLALAGCAGTQTTQTAAAPTPPPTSAAASPTPSAAPAPSAPSKAAWGQTITTRAGVAVTVALVGPMPAQGFIAPTGAGGPHFSGRTAVFKTTLHNGTNGPIDSSTLILGNLPIVTAGADGSEVPHNDWDGRQGGMSWPTIQPGETYSWEWGVDDGSGIQGATAQYQINLPSYQGGPSVMEWTGNVP